MKIRSDFVTNSSSSSFVAIEIRTKNDLFETSLDEADPELYDITDGPISSYKDLECLVRGVLSYDSYDGHQAVKEANDFLSDFEGINVEDIVYIKITHGESDGESEEDDFEEYRWYSGKTHKWYDTEREMIEAEKESFEPESYTAESVEAEYEESAANNESTSVGDDKKTNDNNTSFLSRRNDNFNIVFDDGIILDKALETIKSVVSESHASDLVDDFKLDRDNNKIFLCDGSIGNHDKLVEDICVKLVQSFPDCKFHGCTHYSDKNSDSYFTLDAYYKFENKKLFIDLESPAPYDPYGEDIGFDESIPDETYYCGDCEIHISRIIYTY